MLTSMTGGYVAAKKEYSSVQQHGGLACSQVDIFVFKVDIYSQLCIYLCENYTHSEVDNVFLTIVLKQVIPYKIRTDYCD